jgi:lysophospholipase L1-like esterase
MYGGRKPDGGADRVPAVTGPLKRAGIAAAKGLTTRIIFFAVVEMLLRGAYLARNAMVRYVPLPYALGDDYGPVPPWLDRLLILRPDDALIWRSLPDVRRTYVDIFSPIRTEQDRVALLRRFLPELPAAFRGNPTWSIALNGEGFRSDAFGAATPGTLRIACLGDSWTFGMNVNQDRTYPARVAALLRERPSAGGVEVMNFGVLGYSSFQGRALLEHRVLDLHPDIVAIGFGMNDSEVAGYRDKDMVTAGEPPRLGARVLDAARESELFKLLNYAALTLRFHQKPIGDFLREEAETKGSGDVDYDAIEPWTRVSPRDYDANVRAMIAASRAHGAAVLLVDNELWEESPYRPILRRIADQAHVPLVDSLRLIAKARTQIERDLERRLELAPAAPPAAPAAVVAGATAAPADTTVVFRVSRGTAPVPGAISIVGTAPQLGSLVPNTILMHDDGTGGDERAGDGVWSYAAKVPAGTRLFYVYTNSGARGRWEGLDVPHIRQIEVPPAAAQPIFLPIETFGRIYMQADNWHTDAVGYDLIARAAVRVIGDLRSPDRTGHRLLPPPVVTRR